MYGSTTLPGGAQLRELAAALEALPLDAVAELLLRGVSAGGSPPRQGVQSPRKNAFRGLSCVMESAKTR